MYYKTYKFEKRNDETICTEVTALPVEWLQNKYQRDYSDGKITTEQYDYVHDLIREWIFKND